MTEDGGRDNHPGMITALEDLEICSTGQRGFNAEANFPRFQARFGDVFNPYRLFSIKDGGFHSAPRRMSIFQQFAKRKYQKTAVFPNPSTSLNTLPMKPFNGLFSHSSKEWTLHASQPRFRQR
jgi:hypothetical protein